MRERERPELARERELVIFNKKEKKEKPNKNQRGRAQEKKPLTFPVKEKK